MNVRFTRYAGELSFWYRTMHAWRTVEIRRCNHWCYSWKKRVVMRHDWAEDAVFNAVADLEEEK